MALIGDEALKIFEYFDIPTENSNFDLTISKFDFYILCKKSNLIYERYLFNTLTQKTGETFNEYLTWVSNQSTKCNYENMKEELICDGLVYRLLNDDVRLKLLGNEFRTLDQTVNIFR